MEPEEVTLVVPCYNVVETLPQTLTAIDNLDTSPSRVLCIDDGSTDGTTQLIRRHDGVELVEHEQNRGLGATLNTALLRTETAGMAKIDADIVVEPDWLGTLCDACTTHDVDLVQGRFEEEVTTTADQWRDTHLPPNFPGEPMFNKPINGSNTLARTEALQAVGGWDEQYHRAFDDIDLLERLIAAGYQVYYTPDVNTTHLRTDTWQDVLHTAWAYHYDSVSTGRGRHPPRRIGDLLTRTPPMLVRAAESVLSDVQRPNLRLLSLSLLRPIYHLKYDIESISADQPGEESCLGRDQIAYGSVTLDIDDELITPWIKRLLCRGYYEHEEAALVNEHLDGDLDVVELGAGIGYLSCYIDELLEDSRTQVSVEANERLVSLIERNRELNSGSYELVNAAYSTQDGPVDFHVPDDFWTGHVRNPEGEETFVSVETVDIETILDRYDLSQVSVVVDIEGSELDLIENELDVLESRCELLIVEFHPDAPSHSVDDIERAKQDLDDSSFEQVDRAGAVEVYRKPGASLQ